jgi:hypothetical protein
VLGCRERSGLEPIEEESDGEQISAAARRSPPSHEVGMQAVESLPPGPSTGPARVEHGARTGLRCRERVLTAAMEQAGVVEAGHDC